MRYIVGISDGISFDAGGQCAITASSLEDAMQQSEDWADEGDYPVSPDSPPEVEISLWTAQDGQRAECVARWSHTVPADSCSG